MMMMMWMSIIMVLAKGFIVANGKELYRIGNRKFLRFVNWQIHYRNDWIGMIWFDSNPSGCDLVVGWLKVYWIKENAVHCHWQHINWADLLLKQWFWWETQASNFVKSMKKENYFGPKTNRKKKIQTHTHPTHHRTPTKWRALFERAFKHKPKDNNFRIK